MQKYISLILIIFTINVTAQELDMSTLKTLKPRNIGPGGMSGRVTAIDVVNSNPDIIYVGTASGGIWKSKSGGIKWEPIFNNQPTASIGALAIQQSNPSVVWAGTGEGNPRNSLNGGYGIYKSIDGGKSWKSMGLEKTRHIHRVITDPTNPDIVYVGAIGSPWGEHPERGVFKTTDGGKTWKKILFANNKTGVADMVMDPSNPNKLLVALWEHKRDPWFFKSGGKGSALYMTHDGGENWKKLTHRDGLPKGDLGRIGIAIAKNNPAVVYALIEAKKNALYRSDDGGFNWNKVNDKNDIGNRPFYYSEIYVDPQNENRVYSIYTYVNVSQDGGKNFKQLMPAYGVANGVHPDHHAWWIHPTNGNFMIDGNDGGLNITKDGGKNWRFIGNLPVAQFYHIAVDNEFPYNIYGGMQDNGSWRGPAYVWKAQGIRNDYWQEISFGDGFDVVPDPDNSQYGWTMSQQGYVSRYDWKTGNNYGVRPTHPDPKMNLRFNWNSAINIDPFNSSIIYFGSQFVHKSTDKGLTWEIISPDLTTNDPEKLKQSESGGLTMDATGAENHCTILVIEPSPIEKDMFWVGTDDGKVHYTKDGGKTYTEVSKNLKGLPKGSWIAQIKASNKTKGEALLVANDYRRFNYTPYVYRTTNYGKTWSRIVSQQDVKSYALCIVEDPIEKNLLFLGTDDGLYVSINGAKSWKKWTHGFPTTSVKDLIIHPREHDLVIGTFGRAAWVIDDIRPLRTIAEDRSTLSRKLTLFSPPTAYQAAYQQPTGSRFGADAIFNGENRPYGAQIKYHFIKQQQDKKTIKDTTETKIKWDSIHLKIFDGDRQIRHLKRKTPDSSGIHQLTWNLNEAGVQSPSRTIKKIKKEPAGVQVKPGNYKLVLEYGDLSSTNKITVASDPRLNSSQKKIDDAYTTGKKLEALMQKATDAVLQLNNSKKDVATFKKGIKALKDDKKYKTQLKEIDSITLQINDIVALYIGKEDKRQGITRNSTPTVTNRIYNAMRYSNSRPNGTTATEERLLKFAEDQLNNALINTNKFYKEKWPSFVSKMKTIELLPFKKTKSFLID